MKKAENPQAELHEPEQGRISDAGSLPTRTTTGADSDAETRAQTTWNTETGDFAAEQLSLGLNEVPGDKDMPEIAAEIRGPDGVPDWTQESPKPVFASFQEAEKALRDVDAEAEIAKVAQSKAETLSEARGQQAAGDYGITLSPASVRDGSQNREKPPPLSPLGDLLQGLGFPLSKSALLERLRWQETLPMRPQETVNLHALLKDSEKDRFGSLKEIEDEIDSLRASIA